MRRVTALVRKRIKANISSGAFETLCCPTSGGAIRLPADRPRGCLFGDREHGQDGRDHSLDYKISRRVPRGSWEAQVLDEIAPAKDEMILQ
jgi:hypothetical protein